MLLNLVKLHKPNKQIMSILTLIARIANTFNHMTFGELRNWCDYESLLYLLIGLYKWNLYLCGGRYIVKLKYDWLVMMSLGGAVVSFYHVTSWYIRLNPVSEPQTLVNIWT